MWAREGGKIVVMANQLAFCETLWNRYIETAAKHGRDVTGAEAAAWGFHFILTDDKERAARHREEHDWYFKEWFEPFDQKQINTIMGSADEISDAIEQASDRLGFDEVWLSFGQGHLEREECEEQISSFAEKVIPRFAQKDAEGTWV
jgi:alkanesulfonate monooxygenase SsuD/methylene tetrahydromethanopterin reductase-like flavin-dependent oxidoreductase (luciferase family)